MFFDFLNQFALVSISKLTPFYIILQLTEGNKNAFHVAKHISAPITDLHQGCRQSPPTLHLIVRKIDSNTFFSAERRARLRGEKLSSPRRQELISAMGRVMT
jgi:hypothetical protein